MKTFVGLLFFIFSFNSLAQTLQFYLPKDNGQFLELGYSANSITSVDADSSLVSKGTQTDIKIKYDVAISPLMAVGAEYVSSDLPVDVESFNPSATGSRDFSGPQDMPIYIHSQTGLFYWKAIYYHALEKAYRDPNKAEQNFGTGSHFGLTLGFLFGVSSGIRIDYIPSYTYDEEIEGQNQDDEITQGAQTTFTFFQEFINEGTLFGFEASYIGVDSGEFKDGPSGTKVDIDSSGSFRIKFYPAWSFGSTQLIANLSYQTLLTVKDTSSTQLRGGLDFRFNF